jgi:hypothetical protein
MSNERLFHLALEKSPAERPAFLEVDIVGPIVAENPAATVFRRRKRSRGHLSAESTASTTRFNPGLFFGKN